MNSFIYVGELVSGWRYKSRPATGKSSSTSSASVCLQPPVFPCGPCWTCDPPASPTWSFVVETFDCWVTCEHCVQKLFGHLVSSFHAPSPCRSQCFCNERLTGLWNTGVFVYILYVSVAVFLRSRCYAECLCVQSVDCLITGRNT